MSHSASTHLLSDFTEERFGQSLPDSDTDSKGYAPKPPEILTKRRRPARSGRERVHQSLHALSLLIVLALIFGFFRSKGNRPESCVERQSIYCSSMQSLTMTLEMKASRLLISCPSAPVLDVLSDEYQTWKFNGTFRNLSPYKGPPNAEVDKAWADLFTCTSCPHSYTTVNKGDVLDMIILNHLQQLAHSASRLPTSRRSAGVPRRLNSLPKPVEAISDSWKFCIKYTAL